MFTRVCLNFKCDKPKREFTAFRVTAAYCSDLCRSAYWRQQNTVKDRDKILKRFEYACAECKIPNSGMMFIRKSKNRKLALCGRCNTDFSRRMFKEGRGAQVTRGYARRKFYEKLDAADSSS